MAFPITTYPGGPGGFGEAPMGAQMAMFGRQPMFGGNMGPRYTSPFNAGGQYGPILQAIMPQIMQMLMGSQHMPAQFFPEQNFYDQMEANKYMAANKHAMQMAARRDTATIEKMIGGATQLMTGQPLSQMQIAQNYHMAGNVSRFMPMLTQMMGPDLVDQLHGSRGSATVLAQQLHQALRTGIDPITRHVGYSGESAGRVSQEVFEKMFGQGADVGLLKGMSAGQAGVFINELQSRGMLGQSLGMLPLGEQRSLLSRNLSSDTVNRLAEQIPEIRDILKANGTPNDDALARARKQIRETHQKLTDPGLNLTDADIADETKMPGAQDIIRAGDADRISQRLKNMSGAVKAMRDIFGDMGNPNAPMREILNGLDALTQGGMATMSPGQLEAMVRKTHNLAQSTGIGVEGILAMTAQNAALADQLGVDRSFAVTAAQHGAAFGAAAGDRLQLGIPVWGAATKEQLTLTDQQLMMHAAASPLANQMSAVMRMSANGMITTGKNPELDAYIEALKQGKTVYGDNNQSVVMPHAVMIKMLQKAGVSETAAYAILSDRHGNQEYGQLPTNITRRIQADQFINRSLAPVLGGKLRSEFADRGINTLLQDKGIIQNDTEFSAMMHRIGRGVSQDYFKLDNTTVRVDEKRAQQMGQDFRNRLRAEIRAKMPQATDAEVDAVVADIINKQGGEQWLNTMGQMNYAGINQVSATAPGIGTAQAAFGNFSKNVLDQADARGRQAEAKGLMQSAMSGLGTSDPLRRLVDIMQSAGPNTKWEDILSDALGGVSADAIKAADPNGTMAQVFGLIQANEKLDATDPKQFVRMQQNALITKGLLEGGETAKAQLKIINASRGADGKLTIGNEELVKHLEWASKRDGSIMGDYTYHLGAAVSVDQVRATIDSHKQTTKILQDKKSSAKERESAISDDMTRAKDLGRQLLNDERSMKLLGRGGLELVNNLTGGVDRLQALAAEQSKKLGRPVSISQLLAGGDRIDADVSARANNIRDLNLRHQQDIDRRLSKRLLPGKGPDPENLKRAAMTAQEEEDLAAQLAFTKEHDTPEARAKTAVDEMLSMVDPEQRQRLNVTSNREQLIKAIAQGDRGPSINRGFRAKNELFEMGLRKGIFGNKKKISELTDEDEEAAITRLRGLNLSADEKSDFERLQRESSHMMYFGTHKMTADDAMQTALNTIKQSSTTQAAADDGQKKTLDVTLTGTLKQIGDGLIEISGGGPGVLDYISKSFGFGS